MNIKKVIPNDSWLFKVIITISISLTSSLSFGMTTLKQVLVKNENEVHLIFDGKVDQSKISTEYMNDVIQLTLTDVAVYPAKIVPVHGRTLVKVFAYQYSPEVVRCRLSIKGKALDFKDQFHFRSEGKSLVVKLSESEMNSNIIDNSNKKTDSASDEAVGDDSVQDLDEKVLLENVLKNGTAQTPLSPLSVSPPVAHSVNSVEKGTSIGKLDDKLDDKSDDKPIHTVLTGGKPLPSIWSVFGKLIGVVFLMCFIAFALKKFKNSGLSMESQPHLLNVINRFTGGGLVQDRKMIQVVATHYLAPKKSIVAVRIASRLLVLGISNESIHLITQMNEDGSAFGNSNEVTTESESEFDLNEPTLFSEILGSEKSKPHLSSGDQPGAASGVRSRIRNRLEGLKPL